MFIEFICCECLNQGVCKTTQNLSRKVNDMNKKVMILFASAVLTASIAATGCAHGKGSNKAALPTVSHAIETVQQTTGETTKMYEKVATEATGEFANKKQAPEVAKLLVAMPDTKTSENPVKKLVKKSPSKKTTKYTKKYVKKTVKKTVKPEGKSAVCVPLAYVPASSDLAGLHFNGQGVWSVGDPATYNPSSKKGDNKKDNGSKKNDSKKKSTKKTVNHKKHSTKKSYKLNSDVKKKLEKIKKNAQKEAAKKTAQKAAAKKAAQKMAQAQKAAKKAAQKKAAKKAMKKKAEQFKNMMKKLAKSMSKNHKNAKKTSNNTFHII